jgi:hypothetical protein
VGDERRERRRRAGGDHRRLRRRHPLAFLIKDATDGHGIDGDFEVFGCDREEKLEDAIVYKVSIKPCPSTRDVSWV